MLISDIDKRPDVTLLTDSQDVTQILQDLHCEEDYGGIFVFEGNAYGFEGNIPYLGNALYLIGPYG
jgi:hypothetical protein